MVTDTLRFERHDTGPNFVELTLKGNSYEVAWGRIGAAGFRKDLVFPQDELAAQAFAHHGFRLQRKGFLPGRHEPKCIQVLQRESENVANYSVYADWLLEHGDARGALITAMAAGQGQEAKRLLAAHSVQLQPTWWNSETVEVTWWLGFAQRIAFRRCHDPGIVRRVLRHPSCALVREVLIDEMVFHELPWHPAFPPSSIDWQSALSARPVTLRRLVIGQPSQGTELRRLVGTLPGLDIV